MSDRKFEVRSFADLKLWDWHQICCRLTGYAASIIKRRMKFTQEDAEVNQAFARKFAREAIESAIDGSSHWSPRENPNLLAWLCDLVRSKVNAVFPVSSEAQPTEPMPAKPKRRRRRGRGGRAAPEQVDMGQVRDLFPGPPENRSHLRTATRKAPQPVCHIEDAFCDDPLLFYRMEGGAI